MNPASSPQKLALEVCRLSKHYGSLEALSPCSFSLERGGIYGVVGRNGAGKSTLLHLLAGQSTPSGGEAWVQGISIRKDPLEVRRRVGFLHEKPALYPRMRVREYLHYGGALRRLAREKLDVLVAGVMEEVEITSEAEKPLTELSHGYQQRVGIAMALLHRPSLLLLDEPLTGLDPLQIHRLRRLLEGLRGRCTLLFSSHVLAEVEALCDQVIFVAKGKLSLHPLRDRPPSRSNPLWGTIGVTLRAKAQDWTLLLQGFPQVIAEKHDPIEEGLLEAKLQVSGDIRAALARAIHERGLELLGLWGRELGLEEAFLDWLGERESPPET